MENNAGSGNISHLDTPLGRPTKRFAGTDVFNVDPKTFDKCRYGKKPYARWKKYMEEESETSQEIKAYAKKYSKKSIILQDSQSGAMIYLRKR